MKPAAKKSTKKETIRTTLVVQRDLWSRVQHRAIDERLTLQQLAERALEAYLKVGKA